MVRQTSSQTKRQDRHAQTNRHAGRQTEGDIEKAIHTHTHTSNTHTHTSNTHTHKRKLKQTDKRQTGR